MGQEGKEEEDIVVQVQVPTTEKPSNELSSSRGIPTSSSSSSSFLSPTTRMVLAVAGIMGFFLLYGLLQERIMTRKYGEDELGRPIYFEETTFLVLSNRVLAIIIGLSIMFYQGLDIKNAAPLHKYMGVAASNFSATWCQYEALKYVSFPTQTLGKCGKMLPVMIVGTFVSGKKYTIKDYLIAVVITGGCMIFLLTGNISSKGNQDSTPIGLFLMALYMFFDGFTSTTQEKMFKGYTMSTYDQMVYVSGFSAIISVAILMLKGALFEAIYFALEYPALLWDSTLLSICSSLGQMLIYYTIKEFGALFFSTVMVTRQVISVVLSTIVFLHPLSIYQWLGFVMVFAAIYYKTNEDSKKPRTKH
eukprot:TRINITY_DN909_c0_g1_i1.p1 TRINITY_DN909_c0_g1~~TRINITY_DN909_c0_g1_i1.p1  ORF type:complete len:361 (-),score=95.18 TRINITY_DN909_c0_g1_i1:95-1177(-)